MKIKKLFSFSSQKSSKSCDSLETILRQPQQQVGSIGGRVKGDIHSEYVINEMLGKGGFGRVFSARRICDGTEVAVKEVVKDARYKTDNKNSNSLPTEIALMQQVQHVEGVIKILDCFDSPDCYYIVMEKFRSKDLFDFITDQGPLPEKLARSMFRGIVKTVIECRDGGVLHRDIKDENILVDLNTMNTKLIDFGSGCVLNKANNNNSSVTSSSSSPVLSDSLLDEVVASLQPASASLLVMTV